MHDVLRDLLGSQRRANIHVFQHFVKRLVRPSKRPGRLVRSCLFAVLVFSTTARASFEDLQTGARFAAMANAGIAWSSGAESIYNNPAGVFLPTTTFDLHLFYTQPFGLPDISLGNTAMSCSFAKLAVGLAAQNYGNSVYHENQFLAAVAFQAHDHLAVGVTARYGLLSIKGYGNAGALLVDAGLTCRLHARLDWGFAARNLNNAGIGACREPLPVSLTTGISFLPVDKVRLNFDLNQDSHFPMDVRCGVEYSPFAPLALRLGVSSQPARFCAGFSVAVFHARVDYAFANHADLGATHLFSLGLSK